MRTKPKPRGVIYHQPTRELNEDAALLLGLHAGDGWLSDKWGISCEKKDKSMLRLVTQLARDVLGVEPIKPYEAAAGNAIIIRSGQPQVLAFFRKYGFPQGRKVVRFVFLERFLNPVMKR